MTAQHPTRFTVGVLLADTLAVYDRCSDELRASIRRLVEIIKDPASDVVERAAAVDTLLDALSPGD